MGTITCFDPFRLDIANQSLWQGHTRVPLMPKPFAVLTYLVEHAGRLIPQDELLRSVWPDTQGGFGCPRGIWDALIGYSMAWTHGKACTRVVVGGTPMTLGGRDVSGAPAQVAVRTA